LLRPDGPRSSNGDYLSAAQPSTLEVGVHEQAQVFELAPGFASYLAPEPRTCVIVLVGATGFLSQGPFEPRYKGQQTRHAAADIHIPSPGDPPPARRRRRTATVTPMPTTSRPRRGARGESCGKALPRVFQQDREAAAASIKDAEFGSLHHELRPVLDPPAGADCWNSREHSLAAAARS